MGEQAAGGDVTSLRARFSTSGGRVAPSLLSIYENGSSPLQSLFPRCVPGQAGPLAFVGCITPLWEAQPGGGGTVLACGKIDGAAGASDRL